MSATNGKRAGSARSASRAHNAGVYSWSADEFFAALDDSKMVSEACKAVGIVTSTAYRRRDSDPEFAERWTDHEEALTENLEKIAYKRAEDGSDRLIEFLLRARRPDQYRDRVSVEDEREASRRKQLEREPDEELDRRLTAVDAAGADVVPIAKGRRS